MSLLVSLCGRIRHYCNVCHAVCTVYHNFKLAQNFNPNPCGSLQYVAAFEYVLDWAGTFRGCCVMYNIAQ